MSAPARRQTPPPPRASVPWAPRGGQHEHAEHLVARDRIRRHLAAAVRKQQLRELPRPQLHADGAERRTPSRLHESLAAGTLARELAPGTQLVSEHAQAGNACQGHCRPHKHSRSYLRAQHLSAGRSRPERPACSARSSVSTMHGAKARLQLVERVFAIDQEHADL